MGLVNVAHCTVYLQVHTIQRLMLCKGAKRTIIDHITVIMQYCWDKTIERSGDMYKDDSGHLMFRQHKHFSTKFRVSNFLC